MKIKAPLKAELCKMQHLQFRSTYKEHAVFEYTHNLSILLQSRDSSSSCDSIFETEPIGIKEFNKPAKNIYFSPNPFRSQTRLYGMGNEDQRPTQLQIYSIEGRLVRQAMITSTEEYILSREGLTQGIYLYRLVQNDILIQSGRLMVTD